MCSAGGDFKLDQIADVVKEVARVSALLLLLWVQLRGC
jgi:hypothetical protein